VNKPVREGTAKARQLKKGQERQSTGKREECKLTNKTGHF
jgi:hypothetical protein